MPGVVFEVADPELRVSFNYWRQQLIQVGHRAIVQERRRRPDALQRAGLVAALFLNANGQAVAVHAGLFGSTNAGVLVGALFNVSGDIGQALGRWSTPGQVDAAEVASDQADVKFA